METFLRQELCLVLKKKIVLRLSRRVRSPSRVLKGWEGGGVVNPGMGKTRNAGKSCNGPDNYGECGQSFVFMYLSVRYISIYFHV